MDKFNVYLNYTTIEIDFEKREDNMLKEIVHAAVPTSFNYDEFLNIDNTIKRIKDL